MRVDHSSYAARPATIGQKVLVRIYKQRIEVRDMASGRLLRTHTKADRPGTVVLPQEERVFNPSRETRQILLQAEQIGEHAARLCHLLFAIEGRVGLRKLWGIVSLHQRYPAHCVNAACAQALEQGVYSYRRVLTLGALSGRCHHGHHHPGPPHAPLHHAGVRGQKLPPQRSRRSHRHQP